MDSGEITYAKVEQIIGKTGKYHSTEGFNMRLWLMISV